MSPQFRRRLVAAMAGVLCVLWMGVGVVGASNATTEAASAHYPSPAPHSTDDSHSNDSSSHSEAHMDIIVTLMYPMVVITHGALIEHFFSTSPIPYTVIIFILGAMIGVIQDTLEQDLETTTCDTNATTGWAIWPDCVLGDISVSANQIAKIDPHFLLNVFLPILIFESAFSIDWHVFKNVFAKAALLAGPGLVISSGLTAVWVIYCRYQTDVIQTDWTNTDRKWSMGLLFGAIVSATDPVAVVSVLKTVGAPKYLSITIEGESLLNDGVAVVAFYVLIDAVRFGTAANGADVTATFLQMAGGGALWGLAMGLIVTSWISLAYDQPMVEITATVMAAYMTYFIGEHYFEVSGVLAVVSLGIYFSAVGSYSITPAVLHELHGLWQWLGFLSNTLVFGITGVLITRPTIEMLHLVDATDYLILIFNCMCLNLALLVIRAVVFLLFYPILRYCGAEGYRMDWRDCFISIWGALRGAVGLALAMVVSLDARTRDETVWEPCEYTITNKTFGQHYEVIDDGECGGILANNTDDIIAYKKFSEHLLIGVASVVVFTLLFNSTTIKSLMMCMKMNELSDIQLRLFEMAMEKIDDAAVDEIRVLRDDASLQGVDWEAVREARYEVTRRNDLSMSKNLLNRLRAKRRATLMKTKEAKLEARRRFLAACMSSYHKQHEHAVLSGRSLRILTEANNQAVDHNCDLHKEWEHISKSVPFLNLVDYMMTVEHDDLFKASAATMCDLLGRRQFHVFLLLLHLKTRKNKCMNWIVGRFVVSSIGRACDTASAFMNAREEAIDLLRVYLEQQPSYSGFYTTAQADMATAARAVLCCQRFFPDIVRCAETNRATRIILYLQKQKTLQLVEEGVLDPILGAKVVHSLDQRIKSVMLTQRLCPKLSSNTKHILLNEISWLQGLPPKLLAEVEEVAVLKEFKIDETIVDHGVRPDFIYVIVHGSVAIHMDIRADALTKSMKELLDADLMGSADLLDGKGKGKREGHTSRLVHPQIHMDGASAHAKKHPRQRIQRVTRQTIAKRISQATLAKSGSSRDLFLGKLKLPVVQLNTGSSIGELSWINEVTSKTKFCAVASSTTVEVIGLPIEFVKTKKAIQESLWMTTGRKIVETVLSKQGRFKSWPKHQLAREVSTWKIQQMAKLASQNHYTAVSFCMPVVLMHGEAFKLRHRCRTGENEAQDDPSLGGFQVIVTQREMDDKEKQGHVLCRLQGPRYLRPHVADDRIDDTTATTVTWYIRSESWLCFNDHCRFHYITGAGEAARENAAYSNMRNVFRNFVLGHADINQAMATDEEVRSVSQQAAHNASSSALRKMSQGSMSASKAAKAVRRALTLTSALGSDRDSSPTASKESKVELESKADASTVGKAKVVPLGTAGLTVVEVEEEEEEEGESLEAVDIDADSGDMVLTSMSHHDVLHPEH